MLIPHHRLFGIIVDMSCSSSTTDCVIKDLRIISREEKKKGKIEMKLYYHNFM